MKNLCVVSTLVVASVLSLWAGSFAANPVMGVIVPQSKEKIGIVPGDKASVNVGRKDGIIKGDLGLIRVGNESQAVAPVGQCAVTYTENQASVCELVKARKEIESGYLVFFDPVAFSNEKLFPYIINILSDMVEKYEPHRQLRVCVYRIYDEQNAVTGLSEEIEKEFETVLSQKKRIQLVGRKSFGDLIFHANSNDDLMDHVRTNMRKANVDVVLDGQYKVTNNTIEMAVRTLDVNGPDTVHHFSLPVDEKYSSLLSTAVLAPQEPTSVESISTTLAIKYIPYEPAREEIGQFIKHESRAKPVAERALNRITFNLISPVNIKVWIDDEMVPTGPKQEQTIALTKGVHRMVVSFRRGYFFNDSLLYTSEQEIAKEVILDLDKQKKVVVEMRLSPLLQKEMIALNVYERIDTQRHVIKPIQRVEFQKTIETFKD